MANYTISGKEVGDIIIESQVKGLYPLLDIATLIRPKDKNETITRMAFKDDEGFSAVADPMTGGVHYVGQTTESSIAYQLYRVSHPWKDTSTEGTTAESFYKQNGADIAMDRLSCQLETAGIINVQAAVTASAIQNETANVSGVGTTFDAMTDAQLLAYIDSVVAKLLLKSPQKDYKFVIPSGHASRLLKLYQAVVLSVSGGTVSIDTTVRVRPETMELLKPENILEDTSVTYSGIAGARTSASQWGKNAFIVSASKGMGYRLWNEVAGPEKISGTHTEVMIYEICSSLNLDYYKSCFYIKSAWA